MQATTSAEEKMPNGIFFFAQNLIWNMTMNDKLKLYRVTDHYLDFLRKVEPKIPENKDNGKARPFVGIILSINKMPRLPLLALFYLYLLHRALKNALQ